MPLQDRQDFTDWIARRREHDRRLDPDREDTTTCTGCGLTADQQRIVGDLCIECLAVAFGAEHTERRIARVAQAFATTLVAADPHACHRLVAHVLDHMEDALANQEADRAD